MSVSSETVVLYKFTEKRMMPLVRSNRVVKRVLRKQFELCLMFIVFLCAIALWIWFSNLIENQDYYLHVSGVGVMICITICIYRNLSCDRIINSCTENSTVKRKKSYPSFVKFITQPSTVLSSSNSSSSSSSNSRSSSGSYSSMSSEFSNTKMRCLSVDNSSSDEDDQCHVSHLSLDLTSRTKYQELCLVEVESSSKG